MSMMSNVELNGKSIVRRKVHKDRLSRGSEIEPSKEYRGIASSMVDLFFDAGQEIEGLLMEFWQASYADIAWRGSSHSKRYVFVLFEGTQSAEKAVQGQQEIMPEGRRIRVRQTGSNEFLCVTEQISYSGRTALQYSVALYFHTGCEFAANSNVRFLPAWCNTR